MGQLADNITVMAGGKVSAFCHREPWYPSRFSTGLNSQGKKGIFPSNYVGPVLTISDGVRYTYSSLLFVRWRCLDTDGEIFAACFLSHERYISTIASHGRKPFYLNVNRDINHSSGMRKSPCHESRLIDE